MKFTPILLFFVGVASITALPQTFDAPRFPVVDHVQEYIDAFIALIKELGLDPLHINKEAWEYSLPVPSILTAAASVEEVRFTGLSNIVVNDLVYELATNLLRFDIELPKIHVSADFVRGEASLFENLFVGEVYGSLDIGTLRFKGSVLYSLGAEGAIAESANVDFSLAGCQSDITLKIGSYDLSERVNNLLNNRIPTTLQDFENELNELFSIYIVRYLNRRHDE